MRRDISVFKNLLVTDICRAVFSRRFFFSVMGVTVLMLLSVSGMMRGRPCVWYLNLLAMQGSGVETVVLLVMPVFPFGISYAAEWEQKAQRFWLIRTGFWKYTVSRLLTAFFSGTLVVFAGICLFFLILCPFYPIYDPAAGSMSSLYGRMLEEGRIIPGLLLEIVHRSLSGGTAAVCGIWASALLPDRFFAAAAPFLFYYGLDLLTAVFPFLSGVNPVDLIGRIDWKETAGETFLIKLLLTLAVCAFFGGFAAFHMKRRLLRE